VYYWRERRAGKGTDALGVEWGFTARAPGGSTGEFAALNLGGHVGDRASAVAQNRSLVAASFGLPTERLVFPAQCHGDEVAVVDGPWGEHVPAADALVTRHTDLALAVLVADCTPVLLADAGTGVAAAVHAGRPGMVAGIVGRALDAMADLGARTVSAVVGPSVCGRCYEVPSAMRDEAASVTPVSATVSWTGTAAIDVAAGVVDQLRARAVAVRWVPGCTRESADLYSYRRDGRTGRFAGVVRLLPDPVADPGEPS